MRAEIDGLSRRVDSHDRRITQLETDMTEIRAYLGNTATKTDIAEVKAQIDRSISGILRDALNAVPARHAAMWGGVAALATAGMLVAALLPHP